MASLSVQSTRDFYAFDPNRPDALGAGLSAILPLAAVIVLNAAIIASGVTLPSADMAMPFGLPGWMGAAVWLAIYPMWGFAHWLVAQEGERGKTASRWLLALIAAGLAYPLAIGSMDGFWTIWTNIAMVLLTVAAIANVGRVSPRAMLWIVPSLIWTGALTLFGFATIAAGWSPGFVTNQNQSAL